MIKKIFLLFFLFQGLGFWNSLPGASKETDSLFSQLKTSSIDTQKASILNTLSAEFRYNNPDTSILLGKQALAIALKAKWIKGIGNIYSNLGIFYWLKGNYDSALFFQTRSLKIWEQLSNNYGISMALGNLGIIYAEQGNLTKALNYFTKALKIDERSGDKNKMSKWFSNIGVIFHKQGNFPKSLEYHFKALKISEELNDKLSISIRLSNIGSVYNAQENLTTALTYYLKALTFIEEMGNKTGMAIVLDNIGSIYISQKKYSDAIQNFFRCLKIGQETGNKNSISTSLGNLGRAYMLQGDSAKNAGNENYALSVKYPLALNYLNQALRLAEEIGYKEGIAYKNLYIGNIYLNQNELDVAMNYCLSSLDIGKEIGNKELIKENFLYLSEIFKTKGENNLNNLLGGKYYKQALEYYHNHIIYRDSIFNKENDKKQTRLETQYEYEKAEIIKKSQEAEDLRKGLEEKTRRNILQYSGIAIALFVLFTLIIFLVRIHVGRKPVEAIIFISVLICFEFILVLIDPYVEQWTGGAPAWKLLINATVAVLIYPLHNLIEKIVLKRILRRR